MCESSRVDVAVVGLGLIGGSLQQALVAAGHRVAGFDADPATRESARARGLAVAGSVREAVMSAELVALAVPLPVLPGILDDLVEYPGLITDVTSVKGPVRDLAGKRGLRRFVGGHPMAGKETSGFAAADPRLFEGCAWVLCLEPGDTDLADWLTLASLVTAMGARVVPVTAAEHDRVVAQVSHVPHLFAAALAGQLRDNPLAGTLAAGSFRDGTRVAATRVELTAAMCGGNASAVGAQLDELIGVLRQLRTLLGAADPVQALLPALGAAAELRRAWPAPAAAAGDMPAEVDALLELGRAGGCVTAVAENRARVAIIRTGTDRYQT
jgi:prephenate dehydrogenase